MKRIIIFLFFLNIAAVDNQQTNCNYPVNCDPIYFYGKDYPLSLLSISDYLKGSQTAITHAKAIQFEDLPCVALNGNDSLALTKDQCFIHLEDVLCKTSPCVQIKNSIMNIHVKLHDKSIDYQLQSIITNESCNKHSVMMQNAQDVVFNCVEIDTTNKSILAGTGDGKIVEYNIDQARWLPPVIVSNFNIEGLWLVQSNKILMYKSNGYLYFKNRNFEKPLVRVNLPNELSKIYWNDKDSCVVFSHAGTKVRFIGKLLNTPFDNDLVVQIPYFYLRGEGISYHHLMFLKMLREIKRIKNDILKNPIDNDKKTFKEWTASLLTKQHADLFEPMIATVFKKYLEEQWSVNF
jgi:hypothetical protein